VLGTQIATIPDAEGAAYGAALLAAVGAGWFPTADEACAATVTVQPVAEPGDAASHYDSHHPIYQELYPALRFYGRRLD